MGGDRERLASRCGARYRSPMPLSRRAARLHRWLAALIGLQLLAWLVGGLVMSALPIERVRGEHKVAERAVAFDPARLAPFEAAAAAAGAERVASGRLIDVAGRPAWQVTSAEGVLVTVDARTLARISPLGEAGALAVALADYAGPGRPADAVLLSEPPAEYGRPGPVWRVVFDDADRTALYVDPTRAEVTARRSRTWRVFDWAWRFHVMDWNDGEDFNHPLLVTAAGVSVAFALSGFVLLVARGRRAVARRRAA